MATETEQIGGARWKVDAHDHEHLPTSAREVVGMGRALGKAALPRA